MSLPLLGVIFSLIACGLNVANLVLTVRIYRQVRARAQGDQAVGANQPAAPRDLDHPFRTSGSALERRW